MSPQSIDRLCPVCQSWIREDLFRKETLTLVRCSDCSMVYANPVDETLVTGEFYDRLANPFYLSSDKLESDYSPVRFEREIKLFRRFCQHGSVLDVGCSTGAFLYQLKTRFVNAYEVMGIDIAGPALDYAEQKGVRVLREPFLTADFQGQTFAAVTFWAVMEHLVAPAEFLAKAASVLQPSGFCFILVPNFQSLAVRLAGAKYRYISPQHVNYFTRSTLVRLAAGQLCLEIACAGSMHFNPIVILQDWKNDGKFVPDEQRAKLLKRTTGYKQNPMLKPVKLVMSVIEKMLGKLDLADNTVMVLRKAAT